MNPMDVNYFCPQFSYIKDMNYQCDHCHNDTSSPVFLRLDGEEKKFCCHGCKTVYELLLKNNLGDYYQLSKNRFKPIDVGDENFNYLDHPQIREKYLMVNPDGSFSMDFYLEGIHCMACLWLIERLHEINSLIISTRLNISNSITHVSFLPTMKISEIAKIFNQFGYKPHAILNTKEANELKKNDDRQYLIKVGVAAAVSGNIMLLSISLYAGASGLMAQQFNWLSGILTLPVIFYSAIPFYQNTLTAIKQKKLSIDIPIMLAIFVASLVSYWSLFTNHAHVYFDTITALIFLLLASRYILKIIQSSALDNNILSMMFTTESVLRYNSQKKLFESIHFSLLEKGNVILIKPGMEIPVDGKIIKGSSFINCSLITGESKPIKVFPDQLIQHGSVNIESDLEIAVSEIGENTRLGKMLQSLRSLPMGKTPLTLFTDKVSRYFLLGVFITSLFTFIFFALNGEPAIGLTRALTIMIITCPCALAIGTPLAFSSSLTKLAKLGIIVKNQEVLEKINQANTIVLDKTGTITEGNFSVAECWLSPNETDLGNVIWYIEKNSKHPIAKTITTYFSDKRGSKFNFDLQLIDYQEQSGLGVSATINSNHYNICAIPSPTDKDEQYTQIGVFKNGKIVGHLKLMDTIREDSRFLINKFKQYNLTPLMISGDNQTVVHHVAKSIDIPTHHAHALMSPEMKREFIKDHPKAIMVGDGANDSLSLKESFVGIAVKGSVEMSLRVSDVFFTKSGLSPLLTLVEVSRETMKLIHRNLAISLVYNLTALVLAVTGLVTPLAAAIFMPASSLTVIISNLIGTKKLRKIIRNKIG